MNSCPTIRMLSLVQIIAFPDQYKSKLENGLLLERSHKVLYNYITLYNITTSGCTDMLWKTVSMV